MDLNNSTQGVCKYEVVMTVVEPIVSAEGAEWLLLWPHIPHTATVSDAPNAPQNMICIFWACILPSRSSGVRGFQGQLQTLMGRNRPSHSFLGSLAV